MKLKHPKVFLRAPRGVQALRRNETQQDGTHPERDAGQPRQLASQTHRKPRDELQLTPGIIRQRQELVIREDDFLMEMFTESL